MLRVCVLAAILSLSYSAQFPSFIKKCSRGDVNKECGILSANEALVNLLRGDFQLGIPSYFPFRLGKLNFDTPQLKMVLENAELQDFSTLIVTGISWNPPIFTANFTMGKLALTGEFGEGTQIFGANLPRAGKASFTLGDSLFYLEVLKEKKVGSDFSIKYSNKNITVKMQPAYRKYRLSEFWTGEPYIEITDSDILSVAILPQIEAALIRAYEAISIPLSQFSESDTFGSPLPELPPLESYKGKLAGVDGIAASNLAAANKAVAEAARSNAAAAEEAANAILARLKSLQK